MHGTVIGGWVAVICMGVSLIGLIAVHLLPTGIRPLHDPVSRYHLTRFRPVILISTLSAAAGGVGTIIALNGMLGSAAVVTTVLLVVFLAARALIPFLRMDPPGSPITWVGRVHNVLAFSAFGSAIAVAFVSGGGLHDAGFTAQATWSTIFGIVGAIGAVGLLVGRVTRHPGLFGLFERLIYLGFITWFILIGVTAIRVG